jgi:hypothetical protein
MRHSAVVTTIQKPTASLQSFCEAILELGGELIVVGDEKSPTEFELNKCLYLSLERQQELDLEIVNKIPKNSYSRKMIGYLKALQGGTERIFETDDDNMPLQNFSSVLNDQVEASIVQGSEGWLNAYSYFTAQHIWPRGFPLEQLLSKPDNAEVATTNKLLKKSVVQYLVNHDPDVDAIYRLTQPDSFPITFESGKSLLVSKGVYCPFNSQSTDWPVELIELMYLPSTCSFRMTDIWRSFIAQHIFMENGYDLVFRSPIMIQYRNEHNLLEDFSKEVEGYLNYQVAISRLEGIVLLPGVENFAKNLTESYRALIGLGIFDKSELDILEAYIRDISRIKNSK